MIATIGNSKWNTAAAACGRDSLNLPALAFPGANPHAADLKRRLEIGRQWLDRLASESVDLIVDNGGDGLAFVHDGASSAKLLHESVAVPLASHIIDPLVTAFQGLPWEVVWQALQSDTWHKFLWDRPQAEELARFGVPKVHRLPMSAPDLEYDTRPLQTENEGLAVSFVGGQNTSYFSSNAPCPTGNLLPGVLALAVQADMPDLRFADVFYGLYQCEPPPAEGDTVQRSAEKTARYFTAKLFYNAAYCIKQRDRFVIFLKQKLGDTFALFGPRWDQAYNLPCLPAIESYDDYLAHFRRSAVNLNFSNGNTDSGLNMRHFEITAAGGFMLCYHQAELDELFEVGRECDSFRNEQELLEKIQFYLAHPRERAAIARAGQRRTLDEHLHGHRLATIRQVVEQATAGVGEAVGV